MSVGPFCSLCGGAFRSISRDELPPNNNVPLDWRGQARGIHGPKKIQGQESPKITGLGLMRQDKLAASPDYETTYVDASANAGLKRFNFLISSGTYRTFGLHEFCWQGLLNRLEGKDPERVGFWLFHVFNSLPWASIGALSPENEYHGAIYHRLSTSGGSFLAADPDQNLAPIADDGGLAYFNCQSTLHQPDPAAPDVFRKLPFEIVYSIFSLLPTKDVANLRLSSRHLAVLASLNHLPRLFWESRFSPDREMGFVCMNSEIPFEPRQSHDWRKWYFDYKRALDDRGDATQGIRNRKRIWSCLADFSSIMSRLVNARLPSDEQHPAQAAFLPIHDSRTPGQRVECPKLPDVCDTRLAAAFTSTMGTRVRALHLIHTKGMFDLGKTIIQFSVIALESCTYISGVRVSVQSPDDGCPRITQEAGLIDPTTFGTVCLEPGDAVSCIRAHLSVSGIHALEVSVTRRSNDNFVKVIGQPQRSRSLATATDLEIRSSTTGLEIGFDLYKAVSIQTVESSPSSGAQSPLALWRPDVPPRGDPARQAPASMDRASVEDVLFPVYIYMPLGGPDWSRGSSLCRITALQGNFGFFGFALAYSNGEELLYGQRKTAWSRGHICTCVEQSFPIDGPGGESVVHFDIAGVLRESSNRVTHMEVRTNFGRCYTFGVYDGSTTIIAQEVREMRDEDLRSKVVSLVIALPDPPRFAFANVRSQKEDFPLPESQWSEYTDPDTALKLTKQMVNVSPWMIQGSGSCYTIASLENIRRIRVSKGKEGRSRPSEHITGLWIEYENPSNNTIVGQWFEEVVCIELERGERLVEISICSITKMNPHQYPPLENLIRITRIGFQTSKRTYDIQTPTGLLGQVVRYRETPFERLHSITWAFNPWKEDIQIRPKATKALADGRLAFGSHHSPNTVVALDLADGLTRTYYDLSVGRRPVSYPKMKYRSSVEPLFFQELDASGNVIDLTLVTLTVDEDGRLVGISFQYGEHKVAEHGANIGRQINLYLDAARGERLSYIVVVGLDSQWVGVELHTTTGEKIRGGIFAAKFATITSYQLIPGADAPDFERISEFSDAEITEYRIPDIIEGNPVRSCVGIWAISLYDHHLSLYKMKDVGPVYLARLDEGEEATESRMVG